MRQKSDTALLLACALAALVSLAWLSVARSGRAPGAEQGLGVAGDAGDAVAIGHDARDHAAELVAGDESSATREVVAPLPAASIERSKLRSAAMVSVLVRRVDERLTAPGVAGVTVRWAGADGRRGTSAPLGVTDARGELRAPLPAPGRYELFIDAADVPEGLVAPGRFLVPAPAAPGVAETVVEVAPGEEARAVLCLNDARVLAGRVLGPDGRGLAGIVLRAAAIAPGHQRVSYDFESGEDGVFALAPVLPLEYALRVVDLRAHAAPLRAFPLPAPLVIDLAPGDVQDVELRVAAGRHLIVGTLVDERGEPFPGIDLLAHYGGPDPSSSLPRGGAYAASWSDLAGTAVSDARGAFELGPVHSVDVRIVFGAQAARAAGRGERLVAFGVDPIDVALDAASLARIDIGRVELTRSRTFTVTGTIALAPSAVAAGKELSQLEVTGEALVPRPSLAGRWGVQARPHVHFDPASGRFELSCDGWHERVELSVAWRGQRSSAQRFAFVPEPDGEQSGVLLTFP